MQIQYGSRCSSWLIGIECRAIKPKTLLMKAGTVGVQALLLCLSILLFAPGARAQTSGSGSIQGTVTDPSGALVPNASVKLVESATQVTFTTKTSSGGIYAFPNINVGTYSLSVTAPGFETFTSTGNVLEVGSSFAINAKLTVGSNDVKVEVQANGIALQTEDVAYKQTVDAQEILELPLNGRRMTDLLASAGGTVAAGGGDFSQGSKYSYASSSYSIAGGFGNSLEWRLDGATNDDYMAGSNLPYPFPDAVGQFTLETAALGAQDGSSKTSGMVNVVTKSGTNRFHGDAFEFIRNNYFDATNFYSQPCINGNRPPNCGKDTLHQNQYGGTIGGPILKDKLFAFAGFQRTVSKSAQATTFSTIPTAANLRGDFTVEAGIPANSTSPAIAPNPLCKTKPTQLVDPLTGATVPGNVYTTAPTWNQTSLNVLKFLPPIVPLADGTDICGRVQYSIPNYTFDKQFVTRVDYSLNGSNHLYARYLFDSYQFPDYYSPNNILLTTQSGNPEQRVQTGTVGVDHTFSANLVNSAHAAILRRYNQRSYAPGVPSACDPSIGVAISCGSPIGFQMSSGGNIGGFSTGNGSAATALFNDNTLAINDDVTYLHGKHQFVFGGEFVRNQLNINNCFLCLGSFNFGSAYSSYGPYGSKTQAALNPNFNTTQFGNGQLDFLKGAMSGFTQGKYQQNALRTNYPSAYVQDTFHATPRLTIVAGIRWVPFFAPIDTKNRGAIFNLANFTSNTTTAQFCQTGQTTCTSTPPAGIMFYGDPGVPRTFTKSSPYEFAPNFGATYDLFGNGKTVVRGGASYSYDIPNNFTLQRNQENPPFATSVTQSLNSYTPFTTPWAPPTLPSGPGSTTGASTVGNPFPTASSLQGLAVVTFPNNAQYIVPSAQFKPAQYLQYTASIQQQFPRGWTLNLQYIGNTGHHEVWGTRLNGTVFIPGVSSGVAGASNCNVTVNGTNYWLGEFTTSAAVPAAGAACSTTGNETQRSKLILINPAQGNKIGAVNSSLTANSIAVSNYQGLIVSANHRLSQTFSVSGNYTYSKCLDELDEGGDLAGASGENNDNPSMDYGPCGFDFRHVAAINLVLKSAFHFSNRLESAIINGWEFASTSHLSTGAPFSVTVGADSDLVGNPGGDRASRIPGVPLYARVPFRQAGGAVGGQYLNPAAFYGTSASSSNPATNTAGFYSTVSTDAAPRYGNTGRNAFTGPALINFDSQISRFWKLHEGLTLSTRAEGFNILNHPNFGTPQASISNGAFGQISGSAGGYSARVFQGAVKVMF